jgi:spermidine synthase
VKPFELLSQTLSPDGTVMKLIRHGGECIIVADGAILMSSRMRGSEEELATFACQRVRTLEQPSVLIGGLGMGFTLRGTLDLLSADATVVVARMPRPRFLRVGLSSL